MSSYPRKGDVYWVHLDPTIGSETKKTRPALIISSNMGNQYSPLVVIAPITSKAEKIYPFEVNLTINEKKCKAMFNQLRSIDKTRVGKKIASFAESREVIAQIEAALKVVFEI